MFDELTPWSPPPDAPPEEPMNPRDGWCELIGPRGQVMSHHRVKVNDNGTAEFWDFTAGHMVGFKVWTHETGGSCRYDLTFPTPLAAWWGCCVTVQCPP